VDDIDRRVERKAGVRLLVEATVGLASSMAFLTGLLYLTTRDVTTDPSWPEPGFVLLGIAGTVLGVAAIKWSSRTDPGARERSLRSRLVTPGWLVGASLGVVIWSTVFTTMTTGFGGPTYPWDMIAGGIGRAIRATWAALSGQSPSEDLFPF
jgi:H+/Cl- antiporter ClcA